jgi:Zn-dependent protease
MLPYFVYNAITMVSIIIFSIIILIFSVVIHEVAHGYMAYRFGDPTAHYQGRLTLNPIKHIDPFGSIILPIIMAILPGSLILGWAKPVPYNPYNFKRRRLGEFMTAFAGPLSNILIATFFIFVIRIGMMQGIDPVFIQLSIIVLLINSVLAFFNLIPIPPLDGYRIVSLLLPQDAVQKFEHFAQRFGIFIVLVFVLFLWGPLFMILTELLSLLAGVPIL